MQTNGSPSTQGPQSVSAGYKTAVIFVVGALFGAVAAVEVFPDRGGQQPNFALMDVSGATNQGGGQGNGQAAAPAPGSDFDQGDDSDFTGDSDQDEMIVVEGGGDGSTAPSGDGSQQGSQQGSQSGSDTTSTSEGGQTSTDPGSGDTASGPSAPDSSGDDSSSSDDSSGDDTSQGTNSGSVDVTGDGSGSGGGSASGSGGGGAPSGCKPSANDNVSTGVTADTINVASTVVSDGAGASLLSSSPVGMRAVLNKVNRDGGVCGRRIELKTVNDSWDAAKGQQTIKRFIEDGYFALPVVPSSEGLGQAILAGDIKNAGIPVVGTDGMRIDQYNDPWVWPVATATVSTMRIIAKHAYDNGARTFGIVWDNRFRFGLEGADAFKKQVQAMGGTVKADVPIEPDRTSYGSEATSFNNACDNTSSGSGCDAVVLLLVPSTAETWKGSNSGANAGRGKATYGHQTLFTDDFATMCRDWCNGMMVFTGYNPPIPPLDKKAGVAQYVQDVRSERSGIDFRNQFLQGAYLGMQVFVESVARCSPNVNRACVQQALNSMDYQSDLASTLSWRANSRHANKTAQGFRVEATGGSFNGWQYMQTGFLKDPAL